MNRRDALNAIDALRPQLSQDDDWKVASLVRDLWDGYDLAEVKDTARHLHMSNYEVEQQVKRICAALDLDEHPDVTDGFRANR